MDFASPSKNFIGVNQFSGHFMGADKGIETFILGHFTGRWKGNPATTTSVHDRDSSGPAVGTKKEWNVDELFGRNRAMRSWQTTFQKG
jgi:hypothetical protein